MSEVQLINLVVMSEEELDRNTNHGHEFTHVDINDSVIICNFTTFPNAESVYSHKLPVMARY